MSQLPSQPPSQLSYPAQPLPIGQGMDTAILSLTHSPGSRPLIVDSGAQVFCVYVYVYALSLFCLKSMYISMGYILQVYIVSNLAMVRPCSMQQHFKGVQISSAVSTKIDTRTASIVTTVVHFYSNAPVHICNIACVTKLQEYELSEICGDILRMARVRGVVRSTDCLAIKGQ